MRPNMVVHTVLVSTFSVLTVMHIQSMQSLHFGPHADTLYGHSQTEADVCANLCGHADVETIKCASWR